MKKGKLKSRKFLAYIPLVIHDVEFTDELINPITPAENAYSFISIDSFSSLKNEAGPDGKESYIIEINVYLTGDLHVESRTRYNFWDLLGDVGGFHDGLLLVASLFMGLVARIAFEKEYLNGKLSDGAGDRHDKAFQSSV